MAYTGKNPKFDGVVFTDQTTGTPTNPASGSNKIVNRYGLLYSRNSSGVETPIGAASGSGELNLIANPSAAANVTDWVASGAGVTVARTTTSTDLPLSGIISTAIKITPVSGTDYVRYRFTIAESLKNTKLKLQWDQRALSGYASGDLKVEVHTNTASDYTGTDATLALSTDSSGVSAIPLLTGRFTTTFDANSSDYYEIRIIRVAGTTALNITNVIAGPGIQPQGAMVGPWVSYTPTTSFNNNTPTGRYRQIGDSVEFQVFLNITGTVSAATFTTTLPNSWTIDTTKLLNSSTSNRALGLAEATIAGVSYLAHVRYASTSTVGVNVFDDAAAGVVSGGSLANNNPAVSINNGDEIRLAFVLPISQLSGAGTVNLAQNDVEYASVGGTWDAASTTTVYGPAGSLMGGALAASRDKTITWQTPLQPSQRIQVWASKDQVSWFPINGAALGSSNNPVIPATLADGTVASGVSVRPGATANETIVTFGRYLSVANDDSPVVDWPSSAAYWVVTKASAGQAVGFGLATSVSSGLAPSKVFNAGESGVVNLQELSATPTNPASGSECKIYMKADKFIIQYNDGGTVRYKYLDLTGTGVTWVHTTTAP